MRSSCITGWKMRKTKRRELLDQKYLTAVAKLEDKQLLAFYTSLYTLGVNCLAVNHGTDTQISVQLSDLVVRKDPADLPEGKKLIENPALHLTAIYFMQEMRRQEKSAADRGTKRAAGRAAGSLQQGDLLSLPCRKINRSRC